MIKQISPSGLDKLMRCPRDYQHTYQDGLKTEGSPSPSLQWGGTWHELLHLMRLGNSREVAYEAAIQNWVEYPKDHRGNPERLLNCLRHYENQWGGLLTPITPAHSEQKFIIAMELQPELITYIKGIIDIYSDLDANEGEGKQSWLVDHKTTSRLEAVWAQVYRVSNQFKCYFSAGLEEKPELAGVVCDLVHVTKPCTTPRGRKGKTEAHADGFQFYRLYIHYNDFQRAEWMMNVAVALKAAQVYEDEDFWPMNAPTACKAFGSICPFLDICDTDSLEVRTQIMKGWQNA